MEEQKKADKLALVADVVSSYLRRNSVSADQIGDVVANVTHALHQAEQQLAGGGELGNGLADQQQPSEQPEPAVSIRASVKPDYLVCLDCGAKVKTLKRHLQS